MKAIILIIDYFMDYLVYKMPDESEKCFITSELVYSNCLFSLTKNQKPKVFIEDEENHTGEASEYLKFLLKNSFAHSFVIVL